MTAHARSFALALTLAAVLLAGTACSGDTKPEASAEDTLAAAKKNLDDTSGVTIGLSTPQLPSGVTGLLKADGVATHDPAFKGSIKVAASGITADASVVAVDGVVYAKLPFTSRFVKIDPADYGAPDPANLMNPDSGFSSLLTAAENVKEGDSVRDGKVVLSSFTGTVPGQDVKAVIPSAKASADFDARFTVDDQNRLAEARLTGPFYPEAGDVSYRVTFDDYGSKPTITKP
jgi:lipoprotein LprG